MEDKCKCGHFFSLHEDGCNMCECKESRHDLETEQLIQGFLNKARSAGGRVVVGLQHIIERAGDGRDWEPWEAKGIRDLLVDYGETGRDKVKEEKPRADQVITHLTVQGLGYDDHMVPLPKTYEELEKLAGEMILIGFHIGVGFHERELKK
jgi:hypothetical protein